MGRRITIEELAKHCGLSAMTVSRALRQSAGVKEETREAVLRAAEALGYYRDTRQGRPSAESEPAPTAQLIVGSLDASPPLFHLRLLMAVEQRLARLGFDCIVRFCNGEHELFSRVLAAVRRTDAAVTVGIGNFEQGQLRALQCAKPGLLLLDNPGEPDHDAMYNSIVFDNVAAAELAVNHLLACGRNRILLLTGPSSYLFAREIEQGYARELARHGLGFDPELVVRCNFSPQDAADALERVLADRIPFDAVFTNDEMASAVYRVLPRHHLTIPQDVAVCGCDNIPNAGELHPALTTISLSCEILAEEAVKLIRLGSLGRPYRLRLQPELILRQSTVRED